MINFSAYFGDPLAPGTSAPDFRTRDQDGNEVQLKALRGKAVVLVFYPGDDTPTCTRQLCAFRDAWGEYKSHGVLVYGVNPQGPASHQRFAAKFKFPFPILVDHSGDIANLYRAGGMLVRRTVYAIDKKGVIRFAERGVPEPAKVLASVG